LSGVHGFSEPAADPLADRLGIFGSSVASPARASVPHSLMMRCLICLNAAGAGCVKGGIPERDKS